MKTLQYLRSAVLVLVLYSVTFAADAPKPGLLVHAASSLTETLQELGKRYEQEHAQRIKLVFAASSTLARQIESGAPADVFISADNDWMDYLATRQLIQPASRRELLGNELVLVAPSDSTVQLKIADNFPLSAALGKSRLSVGDPASVPAGKYARAALESLHVWNSVADKLVLGDNVRTTLNFVSRGEAPLGIVYRTDALIDHGVRVVATFPSSSHPPIVYPVAALKNASPAALDFIQWLSSSNAQAVFKQYGFTVLP